MSLGYTGIRNVRVNMDLCQMNWMVSIGYVGLDGSTFRRSHFTRSEALDSIMVMCPKMDSSTPVEQTIVEGCYFGYPGGIHSQGLTLYKDSWQSSIVRNNSFFY